MTAPDVIGGGVVLLGVVVPVVKLWLRLRFRLCGERERRRYLQAAAALPAGSRVREHRDDGTRFTVTVGGVRETSPDE